MLDFAVKLGDNDKLGIGVSGGRDSMALLYLAVASLGKSRILAINIEHGIRGVKSVEESEFVLRACNALGVECVTIGVDAPDYAKRRRISTEQAARELRYREFKRLIDEGKVSKIALAHHKSDQAETVMMRILRGTGTGGLAGMNEDTGIIIRPLLKYSRKEINCYVKSNNIPYVDDESNFSHDYTRNFIRNSVFPEIRKKFPDYENALIRLSDNAREDNELIESMSVKPDVSGDKTSIPVDALGAHKSVVRRSVMRCFNALGIYADIERRHIDLIIKLKDLPNGSALDMPYDVKAHREYDKIVFAINRSVINEKLAEFVTGGIVLNGTAINVSPYKDEGLRFDLDKVPGSAVIRYRKEGDYFTKFGGGTKSLSDYMTDIKIPKRERDYIPLVAAGSEVLIVIGYEISDKVRVDKETKNIYTISAGVQDEQ